MKGRALLLDPSTGTPGRISDDSTASPTVGPDGDVYFGVLERTFGTHNARGWLLHFDAALGSAGDAGRLRLGRHAPRSCRQRWCRRTTARRRYLLMTKYNNYAGVGSGDGIEPDRRPRPERHADRPDLGHPDHAEVLTILGPDPRGRARRRPRSGSGASTPRRSTRRRSRCSSTARTAISTAGTSSATRFSQRIQLTSGIGEAYTPTAVGADGTVYAVNNAVLFSVAK